MCRVHLEYVIDGGYCKLIAHRNEGRVNVIDQLSGVCHGDLIGVAIENVEGNAGNQRIAESRPVGEQIARVNGWIRIVPGAPFVDHELHAMLSVDLAHDLPVISD